MEDVPMEPANPASFPVTTLPGAPESHQVLTKELPPRFRRMPECDGFSRSLHVRLMASYEAVAAHDDDAWRVKYCNVLKLFIRLLRRKPLLERLAGGETFAYTFEVLNSKMDDIFVGVGLLDSDGRDQWKEDWDLGCKQQAEQLDRLVSVTAPRMLIGEMGGEKKVITAMMDMYTSLQVPTPGRLADVMQRTLDHLRVELDLETRVITSETVTSVQPERVLPIFRWFIPGRDVKIEDREPIGTGTYGTVHHGVWCSKGKTENVIVKKLFDKSSSTETSFLKQLQFWYELPKHQNIVQLYGGSHRAERLFFVCEEAPGGNISQFFSEAENQGLFWSMFLQVAQGLQFLHKHRIIHGGLKCGNILIGENNTPKISDFDCSHIRTLSASFSRQTGQAEKDSGRWKPREKLVEAESSVPQFKSDVYSLGMCIIEAKTQIPPFGYDTDKEVMNKVIGGVPYERPAEIFDTEWDVISKLIASDIEDRPDIDEVITLIGSLVPASHKHHMQPSTQIGLMSSVEHRDTISA